MNTFPKGETIHQMNIVRTRVDLNGRELVEGIGYDGDVVLCRLSSATKDGTTWDGQPITLHQGDHFLGALGCRESTTHVVGGVPLSGLEIFSGQALWWLGGGSGIVGELYFSPKPNNNFGAQWAHEITALGLVTNSDGAPLNIKSLALKPTSQLFQVPLIIVAATSAEAGKTTLCKKIIQRLSALGIVVGAAKITGSGGLMDSLEYRAAGAAITFDMVDAGLTSTYIDPARFLESGLNPILLCQDHGAEVVVIETGGDFIWANNLTLLSDMRLAERVASIPIICNDALSAVGAISLLRSQLTIVRPPYQLVASPFRNLFGFRVRIEKFASDSIVLDPNDIDPIVSAALEMISANTAKKDRG